MNTSRERNNATIIVIVVSDTVRGMSRLLGNAMSLLVFALVFALAELHNMSQGSSCASAAAASSSGMCSAVSCGQVTSKDVLYSDD